MLQLSTQFMPYRLKLSRKEPVELKVTITNLGKEPALASFEMECSHEISFDKGGFKNTETQTLGEITPGQRLEKNFKVYGKPVSRRGTCPILIKATEHYKSYDLVQKEYRKKIELIVE